jgi:hypothetical protein
MARRRLITNTERRQLLALPVDGAPMAQVRKRRIIFLAPNTLERVGLASRADTRFERQPRIGSRHYPPRSSAASTCRSSMTQI